jgi:hypothetical protein
MNTQTKQQKTLSFEGCQIEILKNLLFSRLGSFFSFIISLPKRQAPIERVPPLNNERA